MNGSVLIVDEDGTARIIAEVLLQSRGITVRAAADGTEACDILRCRGAAVTVLVADLDPAVSGMNGWELLRYVRGRFGGLPLPTSPRIVAVTRRADAAVERFARRLGADAVLCKPLGPREFITTVERLLLAFPARAGSQESA